MVFGKLFQVLLISDRFLKVQVFFSITSLKVKVRLKTVLNSIKYWKDTVKVVKMCFLKNKILNNTKTVKLYDRFFKSDKNYTTLFVKIL